MSATLIAAYAAQMRGLVEAAERPANWMAQHSKLADLALQTAERMRVAEHAKPREPDLFGESA